MKCLTKIMFICTGNICRSAMAHWLLKKKTEDLGREDIEVYLELHLTEEGQAKIEEIKNNYAIFVK